MDELRSLVEELVLVIDDFLSNFAKRGVTLFNGFDEPASGLNLASDPVSRFLRRIFLQHLLIPRTDSQFRYIFVQQLYDVATGLIFFDRKIGSYALHMPVLEPPTGIRIERLDLFDPDLDQVDRISGCFLNHRQPVEGNVFQMLTNQHFNDFVKRQMLIDLQQQHLPMIAGTDTGRVKMLNQLQHFLRLLHGNALFIQAVELLGDLRQHALHPPIVIQMLNEVFTKFTHGMIDAEKRKLFQQVFLK